MSNWSPPWSDPDEQLQALMGRPGELPRPGNDRWGNSKLLAPGENYTFVNTTPFPMITPLGLEISFSLDGISYSPAVPPIGSNSVDVSIIRMIDVKSGAFSQTQTLSPGESMPFCTVIARGLTVSVRAPAAGPPLYVHVAACPVQTIDCGSVTTPPNSAWDNVDSASFAADTVGSFLAVSASTGTRQVIIQNNTAVDLLLGFGTFVPSNGPPPVSNMILPGGIHAIWESQLGAFIGNVRGIFAPGGVSTEFATFTRGIS